MQEKFQQLIAVMNEVYGRLSALESANDLLISPQDMRPRIDYFHDAVRLFMSHPEEIYAENSRLSTKALADDIQWLRFLQQKPFSALQVAPHAPAPQGGNLARLLPARKEKEVALRKQKPSPAEKSMLRSQLVDEYTTYAMLFIALFAETVDVNFKMRTEEMQVNYTDLQEVQKMVRMTQQGLVEPDRILQALRSMENEQQQDILLQIFHNRTVRLREKLMAMASKLQDMIYNLQGQIKGLDKDHTRVLAYKMHMMQENKALVMELESLGLQLSGLHMGKAISGKGVDLGRGV